jgi:uncharacterized protein YkwD
MIEKRRKNRFLLAPAAALLLLPAAGLLLTAAAPQPRTQPSPAVKPVAPPASDPETVRRDLVLLLNRERELAGAPPLAPSGPLHQVAQARADEIQAQGGLPAEADAMNLFRKVQIQLSKAGYSAHGWAESITTAPTGLEAAVASWKQEDPTYKQAMDVDYQNVGVGVAQLGKSPLYVFLFAWPRSEYYARETAGLASLEAVRQEMLERVNTLRREAGRPPLTLEPRLTTAAQGHADDMLTRTYYSHVTPEGTPPRQRVLAAGYSGEIVAENIAAGQTSVELAVEAWMHSTDHRRNLLDPRFQEIGIGMAVGSYEHKYKILWVQNFGRRRPSP